MNADQVALLIIIRIRLNDEGSATISPYSAAVVFYDSLAININSFTIPFTWTTQTSFVHLEHPSHCILVPVVCQLNIVSFQVNLFLEQQ